MVDRNYRVSRLFATRSSVSIESMLTSISLTPNASKSGIIFARIRPVISSRLRLIAAAVVFSNISLAPTKNLGGRTFNANSPPAAKDASYGLLISHVNMMTSRPNEPSEKRIGFECPSGPYSNVKI
jgi:hypothetical protein